MRTAIISIFLLISLSSCGIHPTTERCDISEELIKEYKLLNKTYGDVIEFTKVDNERKKILKKEIDRCKKLNQ